MFCAGRPRGDGVGPQEGKRRDAPLPTRGLRRSGGQPRRGGPPGLLPRVGPAADHQKGPRTTGLPLRPPSAACQRSQGQPRQSKVHLQDEVSGKSFRSTSLQLFVNPWVNCCQRLYWQNFS